MPSRRQNNHQPWINANADLINKRLVGNQMLESEARFAEGVQTGFASLDRGEYVEHEEVGARIERLLQS
jgi:predicted transcriptional regulator